MSGTAGARAFAVVVVGFLLALVTATGAAAGPAVDFYDDFGTHPDGAISVSESGHSYLVTGKAAAGAAVRGGRYISPDEGATYTQIDVSPDPASYGGVFEFLAGGDDRSSSLGFQIVTLPVGDQPPSLGVHLSISMTRWSLSAAAPALGDDDLDHLAFGFFDTELSRDTPYQVVVSARPDGVRLDLPDGSSVAVSDPRLVLGWGSRIVYEHFHPSVTDAVGAFLTVWSSSIPLPEPSTTATTTATSTATTTSTRSSSPPATSPPATPSSIDAAGSSQTAESNPGGVYPLPPNDPLEQFTLDQPDAVQPGAISAAPGVVVTLLAPAGSAAPLPPAAPSSEASAFSAAVLPLFGVALLVVAALRVATTRPRG